MEIGICLLCPATRKQPRKLRLHAPSGKRVCKLCYQALTTLGFCELCGEPRPLIRERGTDLRRCEHCRHKKYRLSPPPRGACPTCLAEDRELRRKNKAGVSVCSGCYKEEHPTKIHRGICPVCLPKLPRVLSHRSASGELVCSSCYEWAAPKRRCTKCGKDKKRLRRFRKGGKKRGKGRLVCEPCLRRLKPPRIIVCSDCGEEKQLQSAGRCAKCATRHWRRTHPSA